MKDPAQIAGPTTVSILKDSPDDQLMNCYCALRLSPILLLQLSLFEIRPFPNMLPAMEKSIFFVFAWSFWGYW
jgi:hypothetical protein